MNQPTLQTHRLFLRPFMPEDAGRVCQLAGAIEIAMNTASIPHPYDVSMAEEWIASQPERIEKRQSALFAICLSASGLLIGAIGLEIEAAHERAELGYWIATTHWNQGYCTEAAEAVLEYGFRVLGLNRIGAMHFTRNPSSGKVMQKIGMQFEGVQRQHIKKWGDFCDAAHYGILSSDYLDNPAG